MLFLGSDWIALVNYFEPNILEGVEMAPENGLAASLRIQTTSPLFPVGWSV